MVAEHKLKVDDTKVKSHKRKGSERNKNKNGKKVRNASRDSEPIIEGNP